jgi:hypothetical protein
MSSQGTGSALAMSAVLGDKLADRVNRDQNLYYGRVGAKKAAEKEAQAKANKDYLAKLTDFKIDGKYLPVYGKAVAEGQMNVINKFNELLQTDPHNAVNKILPEWNNYLAEKRRLDYANERAINYNAQDPSKFFVEPEAVRLLQNPNTTLADLAQLQKYQGKGITADEHGTFNYNETNVPNIQAKFTPDDWDGNHVVDIVPYKAGYNKEVTRKVLKADAIGREVAQQLSDPKIRNGVAYMLSDQIAADPNNKEKIINDFIVQKVKEQAPSAIISERTMQADKPDKEDAKKTWSVKGNAFQGGNNIWHLDKTPDGEEVYTMSKTSDSENKPLDFIAIEKGNKVVIKGVPLRIKTNAGSTPDIYIATTEKKELTDGKSNVHIVDVPVERKVLYTPENASRIENEYGQNIFNVRQAITGTLEKGMVSTGSTRSTKATATVILKGNVR